MQQDSAEVILSRSGEKFYAQDCVEQYFDEAVEVEQEAFGRERICSSYPKDIHPKLMSFMKEWSFSLVKEGLSSCAVDSEGKVASFCMSEWFLPHLSEQTKEALENEVSGPIDEVLWALEDCFYNIVWKTGKKMKHFTYEDLREDMVDRMNASRHRKKDFVHVCQIGCRTGSRYQGVTKGLLRHHLKRCWQRGGLFAFAECSGPQSTALSVSLGGVIAATLYMNESSSFPHIRDMAHCEDKNSDVAHLLPSVPPVMRLVIWDLKHMATVGQWQESEETNEK